MKCSQSCISEALNNIVGYSMEHEPCPMLLVHPTVAVAQAYSKERLSDMIRSTPSLRSIVQTRRILGEDGRPESTLDLKIFPAGFLAMAGANSASTFARWSVRIAMGDDVDRWPPVVGEEGDPAMLLPNRTTTFENIGLTIFVSTPTLKGGRIDSLFALSDRRRYFVTCPACGRPDYTSWNDKDHFRVVFDERNPITARIECPAPDHGGCGFRIYEPERQSLLASRDWRPTVTPQEPGLAGLHVPGMISPWFTLPLLVEKFLVARQMGRESLKVFINTILGEAWDDMARVEVRDVILKVEDYGDLPDGAMVEVPEPASALTAGVDVQADGYRVLVVAWGEASERWVVDWRMVPGDPRSGETQAALWEALSRRYQHAGGQLLPIHAMCVDSGYASDEVYNFVLRYQSRRVYATKGQAGKSGEPLVWKVAPPAVGHTGRGRAKGTAARKVVRPVSLYDINVDDGKAMIVNSLRLAAPGPNYIHFPARVDAVDEEFFSQLCAEHQEPRFNRGGVATHSVWVQHREANHALDAAVLSLVAFRILRPNLRDMAARIRQAALPVETPGQAGPVVPPPTSTEPPPAPPAPPPAPPKSPARRVWRSGYLR